MIQYMKELGMELKEIKEIPVFIYRKIFILRNEIPFIVQFIILNKNTVHNFWNLTFIWFKQNDQILHGTIPCTHVNLADLVTDRFLHVFQCLFNI